MSNLHKTLNDKSLTEDLRNILIKRTLDDVSKYIVKEAGSQEAITFLLEALSKTNWQQAINVVADEDRERMEYYDLQTRIRRQEQLDRYAICSKCQIETTERCVNELPGTVGRYCMVCVEELKRTHGHRCIICSELYIWLEEQGEGMEVCYSCKDPFKSTEYIRVHKQNIRARKYKVAATLTVGQWLANTRYFDNKCAYCKECPFDCLEHFMPISLNGGTTQDNCLPSCGKCNTRKSDRHPDTLTGLFPSENLACIRAYFASLQQHQQAA